MDRVYAGERYRHFYQASDGDCCRLADEYGYEGAGASDVVTSGTSEGLGSYSKCMESQFASEMCHDQGSQGLQYQCSNGEITVGHEAESSEGYGCDVDVYAASKPIFVDCCTPIDKSLLQSNRLLLVSLEGINFAYRSLRIKEGEIVSKFGLSVYPEDYNAISVIRKKFLAIIRERLGTSFSEMLRSRVVLPSGNMIKLLPWRDISKDLLPVAEELVSIIVKDEYEKLGLVISELCIFDVSKDGCFCPVRMSTDEEKNHVMKCLKVMIDKDFRICVRSVWADVSGALDARRGGSASYKKCNFGVNIRYCDNSSILKTRRKFSCKILSVIDARFRKMLKDGYKFDDDTVLGKFAWFRVSKNLLPIAREEVKHILEDQKKELVSIISGSRAVVDIGVDRELTSQEKDRVFERVMKLVDVEARYSFRKVWSDVLRSFLCEGEGDGDVGCDVNVRTVNGKFLSNLHYEDDSAILNIRRKFSSNASSIVREKFCEIMSGSSGSDLGSCVISKYSWSDVSREMLPIARELVEPLMEKEKEQIYGVLMKARIIVPASGSCSGATVGITPDERDDILRKVMMDVRRRYTSLFATVWRSVSCRGKKLS
ncbi:hypothetical protein [Candidatus Ichthyocystis hellenicum]|uniref:hypothetical protein n=1 Tax=Candidatus Ichthyocystis hellenicum TaxID=1561003 RepID=UPI000B883951|nr:hypothetical protein [Candidatus Ichthyocystis hellenicum]